MVRGISMVVALTAAAPLLALTIGASGSFAAASARPASGQPAAFAQCKACHSVERGGKSRIGPNLFGVVGAAAGAKPGYAYSPAMAASGMRWDRANLDAYLSDPRGFLPGTKMMAPGIKDAKKRKAVVDYLATLK